MKSRKSFFWSVQSNLILILLIIPPIQSAFFDLRFANQFVHVAPRAYFPLVLPPMSFQPINPPQFNYQLPVVPKSLVNNPYPLKQLMSKDRFLKTEIRKLEKEVHNVEAKMHAYPRKLCPHNKPTIINIPIPKIKETELEVVHIFPESFPGGGMGGYPGGYGGNSYYGGDPYSNFMPSYSIKTMTNGEEKTNNFWGYNPGRI